MDVIRGRAAAHSAASHPVAALAIATALIIGGAAVLAAGRSAPSTRPTSPPQATPAAPAVVAASASAGATMPTRAAAADPPVTCHVTRPEPPFVPPKPYLRTPPAYYGSAWYGAADLWTMLDVDGQIEGPWVAADPPDLPQKTFWWSVHFQPDRTGEWEPAITVTGRRLDAPGSFRFGDPGTNASADFGTSMLVGIDYPTVGCWELTARYRDATLSYVVRVFD
jgi:hypothetical protein